MRCGLNFHHGSFPVVCTDSLNFFASFLALNICHIHNTKYATPKIIIKSITPMPIDDSLGFRIKRLCIETTVITSKAKMMIPEISMPIPLPTFPTYM